MTLKIQKNLQKLPDTDHDAIDRLVEMNVKGKLDSYLRQYGKPDQEVLLSITLEKGKEKFDGSVRVQADGPDFYSSRDGFGSLEDLVNHLFTHIKEQMANVRR